MVWETAVLHTDFKTAGFYLRSAEGDEEDEVWLELESELLLEVVPELDEGLPFLQQHSFSSMSHSCLTESIPNQGTAS